MYSISQMARRLAISTYTLRYYEAEQIIAPDRDAQGNRVYTDAHLKWMQFVLKLRETQMPIAQIKQYAMFATQGECTEDFRLRLLQAHQVFIQQQIKGLQETDCLLEAKIGGYQERLARKVKQ